MNAPSPALAARYGQTGLPAGPSSPVVESLLAHRSVRAYLDRPLEPGTLETLVAAASSAPTSSNMQAWSVVAVEEPGRKARLAALAGNQGFVARAPLFLCWIADLSRLQRLGQAGGEPLEGLEFLEAYMVALVDAALAAQNALVAAESLGLGTVYVGALRNRPAEVAAELALPPNAFAAFGLCVGWPDPAVPSAVKPRLPQSLVLHRETYAAAGEGAELAAYDERLADFSEAQGMGRATWSGRMLKRVAGAEALQGRDRMAATLRALGFGLR
ncbi:NADPH-dependent oxidoreductase [Roseomonas sp. SSH11]|uniref:NADPH-dependent oxidoreductase n=1 Tax=Pararoseomonas baculiformis TaxID=2820812 RepID=A0ABS4AGN8_9PROT|nr:NADPH-dependent oxidoreductase [Pararoseomonas baculiformis]MBP0445688.1 NADPH-dependent oxidoreductase [Pararoseomonas baculiformis]